MEWNFRGHKATDDLTQTYKRFFRDDPVDIDDVIALIMSDIRAAGIVDFHISRSGNIVEISSSNDWMNVDNLSTDSLFANLNIGSPRGRTATDVRAEAFINVLADRIYTSGHSGVFKKNAEGLTTQETQDVHSDGTGRYLIFEFDSLKAF